MLETTQPEVAETANQPDMTDADSEYVGADGGVEEPFMTVRYNKEDTALSKEDAITYAQKGMNYDKLSERLETATAKLSEYESSDLYRLANEYAEKNGTSADRVSELLSQHLRTGIDENAAKQTIVDNQLSDFMDRNPGMDPRQLPSSVLNAWCSGVPLSEAMVVHQAGAYRHEVETLRQQVEQLSTNEKNASASMGRPQSNGSARQKTLSEDTIRNMSQKELEKNHERIWAFLTGAKRD